MDRPFDSIKSSIIGATKRVMSFCPYVYIVLINNKTLLIEQTQYTRSILVAKKRKYTWSILEVQKSGSQRAKIQKLVQRFYETKPHTATHPKTRVSTPQ